MRKFLLATGVLSLCWAPGTPLFPALRAEPVPPAVAPLKTVSQTLAVLGIASTFYTSLRAAKLDSVLNGSPKAGFTVFAPTNAAFEKLKEHGLGLSSSSEKGIDPRQLALVLRFHLASGRYPTEALKAGQSLRTLNPVFSIKVTTQGKGVWVGGTNTPPVELLNAYILCSNGVIHLIDDVMIPFNRAARPAGR